jgi:hypothetical protein
MKQVKHTALTTGSGPAPSRGPRRRCGVRLACAGILSVTAVLGAGCGSSSTTPRATGDRVATAAVHTPGATTQGPARRAAQPRRTATDGPAARPRRTAAGRPAAVRKVVQPKANEHYALPKITRTNAVQQPVAGTGGNTTNDDNPARKASGADSGGRPTTSGVPNPCVLVSGAQAQAFTGRAVAVKEAPLGPTCIYQESGVKTPVTMAVQRLRFSALKPHIQKLSELTIGGRTAYRGVYGTAVTYVVLSGDRVLSISAPSAVGTKFAAAALPKLG